MIHSCTASRRSGAQVSALDPNPWQRCSSAWGGLGRSDEIWGDLTRSGEMRGGRAGAAAAVSNARLEGASY